MRIAIIGSGVSGIATAKVLARMGHEVIIFEKAARVGGVWALAYPQVRLQNIAAHYRFTDFDWPDGIEQHPNTAEVLDYLEAAVVHYGLHVLLNHEITSMKELAEGWQLEIVSDGQKTLEQFDRVVIAAGLFSGEQAEMELAGIEDYQGQVLTERTFGELSDLVGKRVAVVGFGKTGVDLASMAAEHGAKVQHVFRAPRWLMPRRLLGYNLANIAAARFSTLMLPSWVHSRRGEALLHKYLSWYVKFYWMWTEWLFRAQLGLHQLHLGRDARARMKLLTPEKRLTHQMRALAPDSYYPLVRKGAIVPYRGEVAGLYESGIVLADGQKVEAEIVLAAVGYRQPEFAYLPDKYRRLMTSEADGTQLYRHMLHPSIPNVMFAGFNHGYMHLPAVEIAALWYGAVLAGQLTLPSTEQMTACVNRITEWKRANTHFELTRCYEFGARFHSYLDVLLAELGLSTNRKSNILAEFLLPYLAKDYESAFSEYEALAKEEKSPRACLPFDA